ncbi:hypothetical protein FPSE_03908 [Fusarium pseudograminearum CS3096]|uniref:Uncharacterized protein n=1 Tax=Fusarium pseudograminearum (strain CS3096) TaxID=1028729 RepID=K3W1I5_FUSPC|nr:hypothetical protein FPSE_03908 [Fusarium pseudograminearum CS3096]EKJ75960.1 hypothetical protein FPSE_03908 [Fusarium pseudograminearum CS3096]
MSPNPSSQSQPQPQLPRLLLSDVTQKRSIEIRRKKRARRLKD